MTLPPNIFHLFRFSFVSSNTPLSPSFREFEDDTRREYLGKKDFNAGVPFLYIYHEPEPKEGEVPGPGVADMVKRLKEPGYPEQMPAVHSDEN